MLLEEFDKATLGGDALFNRDDKTYDLVLLVVLRKGKCQFLYDFSG